MTGTLEVSLPLFQLFAPMMVRRPWFYGTSKLLRRSIPSDPQQVYFFRFSLHDLALGFFLRQSIATRERICERDFLYILYVLSQ